MLIKKAQHPKRCANFTDYKTSC